MPLARKFENRQSLQSVDHPNSTTMTNKKSALTVAYNVSQSKHTLWDDWMEFTASLGKGIYN
ncbi:MAG: hypothetical protein MK211_03010 [Flavobacteriales bacterium]|nr:hypothetical protein [Flavobacteriales bacterium]